MSLSICWHCGWRLTQGCLCSGESLCWYIRQCMTWRSKWKFSRMPMFSHALCAFQECPCALAKSTLSPPFKMELKIRCYSSFVHLRLWCLSWALAVPPVQRALFPSCYSLLICLFSETINSLSIRPCILTFLLLA
jgi:hypothetical protein